MNDSWGPKPRGRRKTPAWKKREKWEASLPPGVEKPNTRSGLYMSIFEQYKQMGADRSRDPNAKTWEPRQIESGAWVPYVIEPMAESILRWLQGRIDEPGSPIEFLREEQFQPLLDKWARAEARRMRYEGFIFSQGEVDERGQPHRLLDQLVAWEKRSAYHAERLGLDPLALARIRRELSELHKDEQAVTALSELQAKYAKRAARPEVIDGTVSDV